MVNNAKYIPERDYVDFPDPEFLVEDYIPEEVLEKKDKFHVKGYYFISYLTIAVPNQRKESHLLSLGEKIKVEN